MNPRNYIAGILVLVLSTALNGAVAQTPAPRKPLTIVVPYTPGSSSDTTTRIIGEEMRKLLQRPVVILNRPGAGTSIGNALVAKSDPDGNTVLLGANSGLINNIGLFDTLPYDPVNDFAPVVLLTTLPLMISARADAPFKTLAELVSFAKENPNKVTRGSAGVANITNIGMHYFENLRGFKTWHVPYSGDAAALNALLAGQVDVYMTTVAIMRQHVQSGRIRGLAILGKSARRDEQLPNVPTVTEAGFADFDVDSWYAFMVPARTPKALIDELNRAANQALVAPHVLEALKKFGVNPAGGTPEDLQKLIDSDRARWVPEIRRMGIKGDQ